MTHADQSSKKQTSQQQLKVSIYCDFQKFLIELGMWIK